MVIFGGEHGDVPLNEHSGKHVAELIATGNRPCIIDLGGWMVGERTRFFVDFASTLFRTTRGKRYIVIDEVHNFAPQQKIEKNPDAMKMKHWANRLASEGRGKGLTILSASQRPQKVDKDFLTCAETLVAMRVIHKLDRDAIKDWIDGAGDTAKGKEVLDTLANNERGQAWVWSPEAKFGPKRVTFPMFNTYDSFAADANTGSGKLKGWASVDLDEVSAKLSAVVEEAKANDPKELRRQIAELRKQLDAKPAAAVDQGAIDRAVSEAVAAERSRWLGPVDNAIKRLPVVPLQQLAEDIDEVLQSLAAAREKSPVTVTTSNGVHKPVHKMRPVLTSSTAKPSVATTSAANAPARVVNKAAPITHKREYSSPGAQGEVKITKTEMNVLRALYWTKDDNRVDQRKIAFFAGYSPNASTVSAAMANLRRAGFVSPQGTTLTPEGLAFIPPDIEPKPTGAQLRRWIGTKVGAAENKVLDFLMAHRGIGFSNSEIAEATGYSPAASTISAVLSKLRKFEAIDGGGREGARIAEVFFED